MRWPLRRSGGRRQPVAAAPAPDRAPDRTADRTRAHPQRADRLAPSEPTTEWARVAPLRATAATAPPLTFHGDRFGRSVAGARTMAASMRHKPADPGRAPSGVLLDAARIESISPVERPTAPDVPAVPAVLPATPPVHRKAVAELVTPHDLMTADADVAFAPAPERDRPLTMMSWSAAAGFSAPAQPADDVANGAADPGPPTLRFVPAPGPRRERPPRDLVDLVAGVTGVDVGDTVIDRSPEVSDRARAIGAIAFTERATVHLPSELGDLDDPATRAVVAHELTHVAQQRTVGTPPSESSPEGRVFEAQAQTVQRSVAHGVRPHFMRARVGSLDGATGVQRLADDDPYAWQQRDEDPSDDRTLEMLGFSGHFGVADRNPRDGDEAWAQSFEERHARALQHRRDERYRELREETLREKRIALLREDDDSEPELDRDDLLALRESIDDEMPFEFGPPEGIDPYPETLPPAEAGDEDRRPGGRATARSRRTGGGTTSSTSGGRRLRASTGYGAGSSLGGRRAGRGPGGTRRPGAGGQHGDDEFEWQHREPTDQGAITALFGGGLFGSLLALATGPETDADRAAAEAATPRLHEQRQDRERELRHVRLREKLTEARREETATSERPIVLSREEIVSIRAQVDQAMPLQFVTPEYVDMLEHARITLDGQVVRAERLEDDENEPAGRTGERQGGGTTATTTDTTPTPTIGGGTTADDARHDDHDADTSAPERDGQAGHGLAGRVGAALASTGAAALAGRVADRLDRDGQHDQAHDDEHGLDGETAGRIFAAASDLDIDVLSRRIWQRIRREMRSELIVDRERAGSLADIR